MGGIAGFRRPEHTGENRCWPCTAVNLGVLAALCAPLGLLWPAAGVVAGLAGAAVIWYRGYLIPYTPRFAPRLARWLPGDPFHRRRGGQSFETLGREDGQRGNVDGERVLGTLVESDAVVPDGEGLVLSELFRTQWTDAMDGLAGSPPEELASAALEASSVAASAEAIEGSDRTYVVLSDGSGNVSWIERPVAIAETAAAEVLASLGVPAARRDVAAHAACAFLDRCPACGDDVVETSANSCCGGTVPTPTVSAPRVLACETCDVRFFTLDSPGTAE